ncbi:MAG: restriction endonuclease [candidate division Zixibacteria bacterium]|nr:restriction endonuclease [candidate division Zixibacteria bacterium]MBU1469865.1 restriction endonuclease [candidate division Zixibacteria bacterium]MBU2626609.1 restriction endonuclease [candidate division Zixibacteria bacterium]
MNADPMPKLIQGVGNQGGFRYLGNLNTPRLIVLTSSFNDPDWPDNLDRETGILTYYGDNKRPGRALHETPRNGNLLVKSMFNAIHATPHQRAQVAPILVFANAGTFRDMVFLGLAVPGASELTAMDDLVAIWKIANGQRFQNYKASLTILNVPCVSRDWLNDIKMGKPLSENCPDPYRHWIQKGVYLPLKAESSVEHRSKNEQIPQTDQSLAILRDIHEYFSDSPVAFEACAANITQLMDKNFFSFNLTRPSRDGGRDAIGRYRVGHGASAIFVDFALEAKCYDLTNSVGVRELSRLISRLRHRQFGVIVTTSYLNSQAYRELKEDGHPVIVITAADIVDILARAGITSRDNVSRWLESSFPKQR